MKRHNKPQGFTLIELLLVMAVVGVMGTFFINSYPSGRKRAQDSVIKTDLSQYQSSLETYANLNSGVYPTSTSESTMGSICSYLNTNACTSTDALNYRYHSSGSFYYIWAELQTSSTTGETVYYVVCSSGARGEIEIQPSGNECPL